MKPKMVAGLAVCPSASLTAAFAAMRTHRTECRTNAVTAPGFVDITDTVEGALRGSGIIDGQVTVFCPQTSCSILVNERETGLLEDIKRTIERLAANGTHPRATMPGTSSVVLPLMGGRLRLGTWQRVLLCAFEGAGDRPVIVQVVGE
jgi:secondary thiamine-phosphate synthase enzyme